MILSGIFNQLGYAALLLAIGAGEDSTGRRGISELIPADPLVVYLAKPYSRSADGSNESNQASGKTSEILAQILSFLPGLIPDEGQVYVDIAQALPLLGRFEHAVVLMDISSRLVRTSEDEPNAAVGTSLRLNHLQSAIILRTDGAQRSVLEQLNRIIGRYTNQDVAALTSFQHEGIEFQRLADSRLPGWAVWEWGRLGDFFVMSFGEGAFERVIDCYVGNSPSLSGDAWLQSASVKTSSDRALAQWFIALDRIGKRLGEVAQGRHERVIDALGADGMDADLWTVGLDGEAFTWYRCYRRNGRDVVRRYSDPANYLPAHRKIIPEKARHCAVITVPTRWLVDNLPRAWVAGQSQRNIEKWRRIWRSLERETGINLSDNLFFNLGDNVIVFDYPPHPLDVPFALTIAIEIKDQKAVKLAVDALLETWGDYLDDRAERKGTTLVRVKVKKTPDDIWYLQAGILGPALKVTDRYVVLSWSPQALNDALQSIESPTAEVAGG